VFVVIASCSSSGGDAESNVLFPLYTRAHTFKKKKKIALVIRVWADMTKTKSRPTRHPCSTSSWERSHGAYSELELASL
jgi:hypothetical protein